ncbi:hypothetical protein ABBQ32_002599 [Trebouxia sp. C0010 RCD-2024]
MWKASHMPATFGHMAGEARRTTAALLQAYGKAGSLNSLQAVLQPWRLHAGAHFTVGVAQLVQHFEPECKMQLLHTQYISKTLCNPASAEYASTWQSAGTQHLYVRQWSAASCRAQGYTTMQGSCIGRQPFQHNMDSPPGCDQFAAWVEQTSCVIYLCALHVKTDQQYGEELLQAQQTVHPAKKGGKTSMKDMMHSCRLTP